jgi:3-deoxy-D-manno-octulosonate 8-phosphate phosphatase KdsC-like HAD superfamily phosphatase
MKKIIRKIRLVAFDFDGVFTDNMVYVFQNGTEAVRCSRGDGIGLQKLKLFPPRRIRSFRRGQKN